MTTNPPLAPNVTPALLEAYLADLGRALAGIDPAEAADVLAGVREHVEASIGPDPTSQDLQDALTRLGPVERIAREAGAGAPALLTAEATAPSPGWPRWAPVALLVLAALALALLPSLPLAALALALATAAVSLLGARRERTTRGLYRIAAALSILTVVAALVGTLTLLAVDTTVLPAIEGPVEVPSPGGTQP